MMRAEAASPVLTQPQRRRNSDNKDDTAQANAFDEQDRGQDYICARYEIRALKGAVVSQRSRVFVVRESCVAFPVAAGEAPG